MIELLYVVFLLSGYIKSFIIAFSIYVPIDITLSSALMLLFFFFFKKKSVNYKVFPYLLLLLILFFWICFTSTYTLSNVYWQYKLLRFASNLIAFFIPILLYKNFSLIKLLKYFIFISTVLNTIFIVEILPHIYSNITYYNIHSQYLTVSLLSGLNILLIIINKIKLFTPSTTNIVLIINLITLFASGGRGGIIFTFFILILFFTFTSFHSLLKFKISRHLYKTSAIILLILLSTTIYYNISKNTNHKDIVIKSMQRLLLLKNFLNDTKSLGDSVNTRLKHIDFSIKNITKDNKHFFFGYGIGSYGIKYSNEDTRKYPHNILLEIWFEMGLIGTILFLLFIFFILIKFRKSNMTWIFLYLFLLTFKSNNLSDLRIFFASMAFIIIEYLNKNNYTFDFNNLKN